MHMDAHVCMCVNMSVYAYMCMPRHMHVYAPIFMYMHGYEGICMTCKRICAYLYASVPHMSAYAYMHLSAYIHMNHMYAHACTYHHLQAPLRQGGVILKI